MNSLSYLPQGFIITFVVVIGLCIGSFLNVAILRGISGEPMVLARSKCPKCNEQLKWYMNIPVLSYMFLKGKCAFCNEPISPQYPIVEALNAILYVFCYILFGLSLKFVLGAIIISLFIALATTDILETAIIDIHAYFLAVIGLGASFLNLFYTDWKGALIGALVGFLGFELLSFIGKITCQQRMFGFGDSLIALALGTLFGFWGLIITVLFGCILQVIGVIPALAVQAYKEHKEMLCVSYWLVFISIFLIIVSGQIVGTERLVCSVILTIILLVSLRNILKEIKEKKLALVDIKDEDEKFEKSPYCILPFGPALLVAATFSLFYLDNIKFMVKEFLF